MPRRKKSTLENPADQSQSPFMTLPPELRNRIYGLALQDLVVDIPARSRYTNNGKLEAPGFLMASKQIYSEAIGIFYHDVSFRVDAFAERRCRGSLYRLPQWLKKINKIKTPSRAILTKLLVRCHVSDTLIDVIYEPGKEVRRALKFAEDCLITGYARVSLPEGFLKAQLSFGGDIGSITTDKSMEVYHELAKERGWQIESSCNLHCCRP